MRRALLELRSILVSVPLIIFITLICGLAVLIIALLPGTRQSRRKRQQSIMRLWARAILRASFVHVRVTGREHLPAGGNYILCVNHLSYLDPPVIAASLSNPATFLAKRSLFSIPVFGWAMRAMGQVPLDRENAREASRNLAT